MWRTRACNVENFRCELRPSHSLGWYSKLNNQTFCTIAYNHRGTLWGKMKCQYLIQLLMDFLFAFLFPSLFFPLLLVCCIQIVIFCNEFRLLLRLNNSWGMKLKTAATTGQDGTDQMTKAKRFSKNGVGRHTKGTDAMFFKLI